MPEEITNEAANSQVFLGLDLGSHTIRYGLVSSTAEVQNFRSEPYEPGSMQDAQALIDQIRRVITRSIAGSAGAKIGGLGLAVPGMVHNQNRTVQGMASLPDLASIDLSSTLEKEFRLPVTIENNARAAAFAEQSHGAAQGVADFLYLHIGANFSAGLVLEGRLQYGRSGLAGAIGRMKIYVEHLAGPVRLEDLVSAANIVRRTRIRLERDKTSSLSRLGIGGGFSYDDIIDCAHQGDQLSRMMIDRTGNFIAIAIADVISLLNLSMVVIGGAVAARQFLVGAIDPEVRRRMSEAERDDCRIVPASLGPEATVLGVGMLGRRALVR